MNLSAISQNVGSRNLPGSSNQPAMDTYSFLRLLITELTAQNPLEPVKDREFMAQLAQLNMAQSVERLGRLLTGLQAASLIGRNVEALLPGTNLRVSGTVQGVEISNGNAQLRVNDQLVPFEAVQKVW